MKTTLPSHDDIARRAHELWTSRDRPDGCATAIWLEAEHQLTAHPAAAPVPSPDDLAAKALLQKNAARSPQLQHGKNAPKPAPTESGKPLWDKPHSS